MNRTDLHGLLAAVERARKTLEDTDAELEAVQQCLEEALSICRIHDPDDVVPGRICGRPLPCREHEGSRR
jgi:hypothetical protein